MTMIGYMPDEISKYIHDFIRPIIIFKVISSEREGGDTYDGEKPKPIVFNKESDAWQFYNSQFNKPDIRSVELVKELAVPVKHLSKYKYMVNGRIKKLVVSKKKIANGKPLMLPRLSVGKCKNVCSYCNIQLQSEFKYAFNRGYRKTDLVSQNVKYKKSDCCDKIICSGCAISYFGGMFCPKEECIEMTDDFEDSDSDSDSD